MSELTDAILAADITLIRSLVRQAPNLMVEPSQGGTLPLDLARRKGRVDAEVALVVAGAPCARSPRPAVELLMVALRELSEDCACAGWLSQLEYLVWTAVLGEGEETVDRDGFGLSSLDQSAASDLAELARRVGGWIAWSEEAKAPRVVTMETWVNMYAKWRNALSRERS